MNVLASMIRNRQGTKRWRQLASRVVAGKGRDLQALRDIYDYVNRELVYTRDPAGVDIFFTAERALGRGLGDCDEQSQLVGILAGAHGMPVMLRAISIKPGRFTHIYPLVEVNGKWVAADVTYGRGVGAEVPHLRSMEVQV
jgi:hypothetical protein